MAIALAKGLVWAGFGVLTVLLGQGAIASPFLPNPAPSLTQTLSAERWQVETQIPALPALEEQTEYLPEEIAVVHLVLKLGQRRVYVHRGEEVLASYPVAIGRPNTPTPTGEFEVFQMIEDPVWQNPWTGEVRSPGANSALGLRWIAFAPMSNGVIGFHGTPTISSIGQAASNGCIRMHNADVVALFEQVEVGTTVRVEP